MISKVEIRTDLIDPHTYLEAELNYKDLLETIDKCGGYALFQQIYKWFDSKSKGFREIKKLQELSLIGSEQFNNNKYVYLKSAALKYLKFKDSDEDTTEYKISRLIQKPGFRPIMNSIYTLEYLMAKGEYINTDTSIKTFLIFIDRAKEIFEKDRFTNLHLGKIVKDDYVQKLCSKLKILGDRNGIFLKKFSPSIDLKDSVLEFVWFDFNTDSDENPILRISRLISKFLNNIGTTGKNNLFNCCQFSLEIITMSEKRKSILESLSKKAVVAIEKKNKFYLNCNEKFVENQVISHLKEFKYQIFVEFEGYLRISSKGESEFSFVGSTVIDRLEKLKEHLKGGN